MSEIRNSQDAWSLFKSLAQQVGGSNNISDADIKELIKKADTNNDGLIFESELKDTLLSYEEYLDIEDSYLDAFEAIAKEDGVDESISDDDIESIINGTDTAGDATGAEEAAAGADGVGAGGAGATPNAGNTGTDAVDKHENVSRSDLEGKDASALQNERSGLLNDLSSMRNEKNTAIADADRKTAEMQSSYDKATQDFTNLLATQEETEQSAIDASQKVQDLENKKN